MLDILMVLLGLISLMLIILFHKDEILTFFKKYKQKILGVSAVASMIVAASASVLIPTGDAQHGDWEIVGNSVQIDDDYLFASATPHTITGNTLVEFNFRSKVYSGDIDFIWGFDVPNVRPTDVEIWKNYTHYYTGVHIVEKYGSSTIYNVTEYTNLGIENYDNYTVTLGNKNNTYLFNISYDPMGNGTIQTGIYAFSSYDVNGDDYTLSGYYDKSESYEYIMDFFDWKTWNPGFNKINYEHGGMNTWYTLSGISIIQGVDYKIRARMQTPFSLNSTSGKYWWAFKPSSETIAESISNNHFYALDPWWNSNWNYYKQITLDSIDQVPSTLTNFPILINITDTDLRDNAKSDGSDIAFVLASDNTTQFKHEIERFDNTIGNLVAWVNITSLPHDSDLVINMYYGNAGASNQTDKNSVWDSNYLAVWHLTSLLDSTSNSYTLTNDGCEYVSSGRIAGCYNMVAGNQDTLYNANLLDTFPSEVTYEAWFNSDQDANVVYMGKGNQFTSNFLWMGIHLSDDCFVWSRGNGVESSVGSTNVYVPDSWYYSVASYKANTNPYVYLNDVKTQDDTSPGTIANDAGSNFYLGSGYDSIYWHDGDLEECRVSNTQRSSDWLTVCYNTVNNATAGSGFIKTVGVEQSYSAPGNSAPSQSGESPTDSSTNIALTPTLYVVVNDTDTSDTINATWWSDSSGNWVQFGSNNSVSSDTNISMENSNFSSIFSTYTWSVNLSDGMGGFNNKSYSFKTIDYTTAINITDESLTSRRITFSGKGGTVVWCNSSGTNEWGIINITIASSDSRSDIRIYVDDLDVNVTANNMSIQFSSDNVTWGSNYTTFSSGGSYVYINSDNWLETNGMYGTTPFSGDSLSSGYTNIYFVVKLNIPSDATANTYTTNITAWNEQLGSNISEDPSTFSSSTFSIYPGNYDNDTFDNAINIRRHNNYLYMSSNEPNTRTFSIFEINATNKGNITLLGYTTIGEQPRTISLSDDGNYAFVGTTSTTPTAGFAIINCTDKDNPVFMSNYSLGVTVVVTAYYVDETDIVVACNYYNDSISTFDVSDKNNPVFLDNYSDGTNLNEVHDVWANSTHAFTISLTGSKLASWNIADASNIVAVQQVGTGDETCVSIVVDEDVYGGDTKIAYLSHSAGLAMTIFNISNPSDMTEISYIDSGVERCGMALPNADRSVIYVLQADGGSPNYAKIEAYNLTSLLAGNNNIAEYGSVNLEDHRFDEITADGMAVWDNWIYFTVQNGCGITILRFTNGSGFVASETEYFGGEAVISASNNAPTQTGESPTNTSTDIGVTPSLYVICLDDDADTMNSTWWSNSSGSWVQFASNDSISTNTNITQTNTNFSAYSTTYYWSVNLTDETAWNNETYSFTTIDATIYNTTIRNDGIDYFVWLGDNTTASVVDNNFTGFDEASEYIGIWNNGTWSISDANWIYWYGDESGTDFNVYTFDVIVTYFTDTGTQDFNMTENTDMNYTASYSYTWDNTSANKGYNYTGFNNETNTSLSAINASVTLQNGEAIGLWNETTYTWNWWLPTFYEVDVQVNRWDVIISKVEDSEIWTT